MKSDVATIFENCPIRRAMDLIGGKWTLLILHALGGEQLRFAELRRKTHGISDKMLTQELRRLEAGALVVRKDYGEVPPRVDYTLTALGKEALEVVEALARFGMVAGGVRPLPSGATAVSEQ